MQNENKTAVNKNFNHHQCEILEGLSKGEAEAKDLIH